MSIHSYLPPEIVESSEKCRRRRWQWSSQSEAGGKLSPTSIQNSPARDSLEDPLTKNEFEDADIDDELDPGMKEELDREVEDFARRLNSDWPERVQEILSLGQERRLS